MARINGVSRRRAGLMTRMAYSYSQRLVGKVAEPLTIHAHQPWIFRAYCAYEWGLSKAHRVDPKLRALASIKVSTTAGCPY